jgi:hypothetical protein
VLDESLIFVKYFQLFSFSGVVGSRFMCIMVIRMVSKFFVCNVQKFVLCVGFPRLAGTHNTTCVFLL